MGYYEDLAAETRWPARLSSVMTALISVVLPTPEGPTKATTFMLRGCRAPLASCGSAAESVMQRRRRVSHAAPPLRACAAM